MLVPTGDGHHTLVSVHGARARLVPERRRASLPLRLPGDQAASPPHGSHLALGATDSRRLRGSCAAHATRVTRSTRYHRPMDSPPRFCSHRVHAATSTIEQSKETKVSDTQIHLTRPSLHYWRVTFDHPPLNIFGPDAIPQLNEIVTALETDEHVNVV